MRLSADLVVWVVQLYHVLGLAGLCRREMIEGPLAAWSLRLEQQDVVPDVEGPLVVEGERIAKLAAIEYKAAAVYFGDE